MSYIFEYSVFDGFLLLTDLSNSRIYPPTVYSEIGSSSAEMACNSDGHAMWFYEKGNIPSNAYTQMASWNKYVIYFNNINLYNYGTYYCFGWDAIRLKYFVAEGFMMVYGELCISHAFDVLLPLPINF